MMIEFYFQKLEKAMPKCRLNKLTREKTSVDKQSPPSGGQNLSEFFGGFCLRTETRWLSNKNHPKDVSNVRVFYGDFLQL